MVEKVSDVSSPTDIADGRSQTVLSARVLRKREIDRKCQRMIRERTKSRIAYLENIVEHFRQSDPDERIQSLTQQLDETIAMRDSLMRKMHHIENIIAGNLQTPVTEAKSSSQASFTSHNSVDQHTLQTPGSCSSNKASPRCGSHSSSNASSTDQVRASSFARESWEIAQNSDPAKFSSEYGDLPIRIVVKGWQSIEDMGNLHPIWRSLKIIDEICSNIIQPHERLAILVNLCFGIEANLNPVMEKDRNSGASWLEQSVYDLIRLHSTKDITCSTENSLASYRYSCATFWRLFCQNFQLSWHHEFRDCYVHDLQNGRYSISPTFYERVVNSRFWSMEGAFFEMYPELHRFVPAPVSNPVEPKVNSNSMLEVDVALQGPIWNGVVPSNRPAVRNYNSDPAQVPAQYMYASAPASTCNNYKSYNFYTPLSTPVAEVTHPMHSTSDYSPWPRQAMYQYSVV